MLRSRHTLWTPKLVTPLLNFEASDLEAEAGGIGLGELVAPPLREQRRSRLTCGFGCMRWASASSNSASSPMPQGNCRNRRGRLASPLASTRQKKALSIAQNALKRAPLLIPLFNHCYIPCNTCLAKNPRRESHLLLWSGSL
uniref:Uncharacterized protein n=1 Tax=Nelumbo nucifera TaxID=4432 RepID=A0A822XTW6_NELNU|nr:TPA_asm: hypothetical protein HUJ06_026528 [Nelumbo nucifera]